MEKLHNNNSLFSPFKGRTIQVKSTLSHRPLYQNGITSQVKRTTQSGGLFFIYVVHVVENADILDAHVYPTVKTSQIQTN